MNVDRVGPAVTGGVRTTEYELLVDSADQSAFFGVSPKLVKWSFRPLRIWVDGDRRLRQEQFRFSGRPLGKMRVTFGLSRFGIPLHVLIPPATAAVETLRQLERAAGPWTNTELMGAVRAAYPGFDRALLALQVYDSADIYGSGWLSSCSPRGRGSAFMQRSGTASVVSVVCWLPQSKRTGM